MYGYLIKDFLYHSVTKAKDLLTTISDADVCEKTGAWTCIFVLTGSISQAVFVDIWKDQKSVIRVSFTMVQ